MTIFDQLKAPFPSDRVSWRIGPTMSDKSRGLALCFIDARDVMQRLDDVCGPAYWQCRYPHANGKTVCEIGLKIDNEWIWKADGAGDTDMEAEKGALSDAFKRAAVRWGIGRYLYDIPSQWVDIEQKGRTWVIKAAELPKLARILEGLAQPQLRGLERATTDLASDLILELRRHTTLPNLKAWGEAEKARIGTLDEANRVRVQVEYLKRARSFKGEDVAA